MRLITVLRAQHLDRMFKKHWVIQGRRKIIETGAEAALTAKGIPVIDASEAIKEKRQIEKYVVVINKTIISVVTVIVATYKYFILNFNIYCISSLKCISLFNCIVFHDFKWAILSNSYSSPLIVLKLCDNN